MDDLLQKLRAAKPEARDQRDRRRRARLKDKHQVRVASGQKMPEIGVNMEDEEGGSGADNDTKKGILSPTSEIGEGETNTIPGPGAANGEVDIADRAAAMLEGLQGGSGGGLNKDGSLSVRRRRESADTERQRRRNRRQQASSTREGDDGGPLSPAIPEEGEVQFFPRDGADDDRDGEEDGRIIVSPPSPEGAGKGRALPTPPPE